MLSRLNKGLSLNHLLLLIIIGALILFSAAAAFAQVSADNPDNPGNPDIPFSLSDKAYAEKLILAKENSSDINDNRSSQALDQQNQTKEDISAVSAERFIVKFKDDVPMQQISEIVNPYKYKIIGNSERRMFVLELSDLPEFTQRTINLVDYLEEDEQVKCEAIPSDPYYSYQWALPATKLPGAWDICKGSNSVYVAVIDSGVYREHPDLGNADIRKGWDYIFDVMCDWDSTGHGTNVTGIIGAETNNAIGIAGVDWDVAIIPLRVIWSDGSAYISDVAEAIYDAADIDCEVINISLGTDKDTSSLRTAVSYAISKGCIVAAAAGNDGNSSYSYPASYDGVISVGSIKSNLTYSSFSQYNNRVDVAAPGENIYTTAYWIDANGKDYIYTSGTSLSTPYVSGIAALAAAYKPSITADEFYAALIGSCTDLGAPGYDKHYGYGLINAEKLLQSISEYTITANAALAEAGTVSGAGTYAYGSKITLTAKAKTGYKFINWTENGTKVSTNPNYTFTVTANRNLTANFEEDRGLYSSLNSKSNIIPTKNWLIKFNENVDATTVNDKNVFVTNSNGVKMTVTYKTNVGKDLKTVQLIPQSAYTKGDTYTIWLKNVKSASGKALAKWTLMDFMIQPS